MGKKQIGTYCVIGLIAAAVCLFLKNADRIASVFSLAFSAAAPLLVGCVIAYVLNILLKRIERFWFPGTKRKFLIKLRRPVCILLSFLALVLIMAGVVYLVVPELVSSIRLVTDEIPPVIEEIRLWAIAHLEEMPEIQTYLENADIDWKNMMEKAVNILLTGAGGIFNSVFQGHRNGSPVYDRFHFCRLPVKFQGKAGIPGRPDHAGLSAGPGAEYSLLRP